MIVSNLIRRDVNVQRILIIIALKNDKIRVTEALISRYGIDAKRVLKHDSIMRMACLEGYSSLFEFLVDRCGFFDDKSSEYLDELCKMVSERGNFFIWIEMAIRGYIDV